MCAREIEGSKKRERGRERERKNARIEPKGKRE
jgi:hypothetical protein